VRGIGTRARLAVSALAIAAGCLIPATAAEAHGSLTVACTFHGFAEPTPPIPYVGGSGTITFEGTADCTEEHNGKQIQRHLTLTETATYTSTVCGTGTADTHASLRQGKKSMGSAHIQVTFAAGQGAITGTYVGDGPWKHHAGDVNGAITVGPGPENQSGPPPDGPCVTQFESSGTFTMTEGS
jgi:hypothetical protein